MQDHSHLLSHHAMYSRIHIAAIYISYAAFLAASLAALLYLIQDNAIKTKRKGVISSRLPSLSFLDKFTYRSIGLGFPILTLSILSGVIRAGDIYGTYWWSYSSRQLFSIVLWLTYAVILHVRLSARMRGRKIAFLSLFAFFVILLSIFGACP